MPLPLEAVESAVAEHGSIRGAAVALGLNESSVRRRLARSATPQAGPTAAEKAGAVINHEKGEAIITGPPSAITGNVEQLIRENGLDPADWIVVSTTLNRWNALGKAVDGKNPTHTLRQVKVTLRLRPERVFPQPVAVPASLRLRKAPLVHRPSDAPTLTIVEYDHQAPYHDVALDAAMTAMHFDLQPDVQAFGGDLMDFPTISKHPDHPAARAGVQECLDAGHGILLRRREAAPNALRRKIKGNHDWRPESELLLRAERMYGICPVGETIPALSLRRLLHLDALGVDLVEHPLGWQHAEIELVPGPNGLGMRHGWVTGSNTAERSLKKRGRSLLVGHTHGRETVYWWDPSAQVERQGAVVGCMCMVRGGAESARLQLAMGLGEPLPKVFPNFAPLDTWTQGAGVVTSWPDGSWIYEHVMWDGHTLRWRDRRWTA